jgi:hypothetical protein
MVLRAKLAQSAPCGVHSGVASAALRITFDLQEHAVEACDLVARFLRTPRPFKPQLQSGSSRAARAARDWLLLRTSTARTTCSNSAECAFTGAGAA